MIKLKRFTIHLSNIHGTTMGRVQQLKIMKKY